MTKNQNATSPPSLIGPTLSHDEANVFVNLQSSGVEGYIALGSILTSIVETKNFPDVEAYLLSLSPEEQSRIRSHAASILEDGTNKRVQREISKIKNDLWISATDSGIKRTLDSHRLAMNADVDGLIDASKNHIGNVNDAVEKINLRLNKSESVRTLIKNSIISGMAFGLFLILVQLVENPFAGLIAKIISNSQ